MEFNDNPAQAAWRNEVRTFLKDNLDPSLKTFTYMEEGESDTAALGKYRSALADRGWIASAWPKEYGGAGLGVMDQFILNQEFAEAGAPNLGGSGVMMLGPTLIAHGTEEQKKEHLGRILRGESVWCQGYSEPGSGSDLASLQTRAIRDGDDYVINGQKIWTSGAHRANWMFMLARTDPDAPKHRGISYFLIDMKTPGINVRPLINMGNMHSFNEVFFEDVRVPASNIVGEVNRGWYVGATTLDFERSSIGSAVGHRHNVEKGVEWMHEHRTDLSPSAYQSMKAQWSERAVEVQVALLLSLRVISMQARGEIPNAEASATKLYSSELSQRIARTSLATIGMWGGVTGNNAPMEGEAARTYLGTVASTIAGGTSEIQRNIIATRGLGLPRG
ncbi:acyl-CoA dehydrogenase family protein [bacterium]|jgi:alkylation response protein AidB-like acyl-CoA dehydrogenase|nr:acyl-CoA dehydrogenase family protein [bacterium]